MYTAYKLSVGKVNMERLVNFVRRPFTKSVDFEPAGIGETEANSNPTSWAIEYVAASWEQEGVGIDKRLRFIEALELSAERKSEEKQQVYQEKAAELRRRWGLIEQKEPRWSKSP